MFYSPSVNWPVYQTFLIKLPLHLICIAWLNPLWKGPRVLINAFFIAFLYEKPLRGRCYMHFSSISQYTLQLLHKIEKILDGDCWHQWLPHIACYFLYELKKCFFGRSVRCVAKYFICNTTHYNLWYISNADYAYEQLEKHYLTEVTDKCI